jgi:hypothetical protein
MNGYSPRNAWAPPEGRRGPPTRHVVKVRQLEQGMILVRDQGPDPLGLDPPVFQATIPGGGKVSHLGRDEQLRPLPSGPGHEARQACTLGTAEVLQSTEGHISARADSLLRVEIASLVIQHEHRVIGVADAVLDLLPFAEKERGGGVTSSSEDSPTALHWAGDGNLEWTISRASVKVTF